MRVAPRTTAQPKISRTPTTMPTIPLLPTAHTHPGTERNGEARRHGRVHTARPAVVRRSGTVEIGKSIARRIAASFRALSRVQDPKPSRMHHHVVTSQHPDAFSSTFAHTHAYRARISCRLRKRTGRVGDTPQRIAFRILPNSPILPPLIFNPVCRAEGSLQLRQRRVGRAGGTRPLPRCGASARLARPGPSDAPARAGGEGYPI